jgi:uncharacterized protein (TIGR00251 family)
MLHFQVTSQGLIFRIHVQPRSSRNQVVGIHDDAIKIKITAPPVDDAANRMCIELLSKNLHVASSLLEIVSGRTSRSKKVLYRYGSDVKTDDIVNSYKVQIMSLIPK